jgi:hypothetical protein
VAVVPVVALVLIVGQPEQKYMRMAKNEGTKIAKGLRAFID